METVIGKQQENLGAQNDFLEFYKNISPGYNQFSFEKEKLDLILIVGDISDIIKSFHAKIDAWYLDGFSPSKNPEMWTNEIFSFMKRNSKKGATFSTYSTAGFVREGLTNAGFKIEKSQGFGNKKNMLKGIIPIIQQTFEHKPWFRVPKINSKNKSAVIIGGGLAGTSIAFALSEKKYKVTLIERENKIASGASGNPAGMFAPVLTRDISDLSKWSVASFNAFLNFLSIYGKDFPEIFRQIGVIQSVKSREELRVLEKSLKNYVINSNITIVNNANQKFKGLFFSNAGWINPVQLSETYLKLAKHNLNLILSTSLIQIKNENTHWKVYLNNGDILETETLVIANSFDAKDFIQDLDKVKKVRGQILFFPSHEFPYPLENILLHDDGYIIPNINGMHIIGSSFDPNDDSTQLNPEANVRLLQNIKGIFPEINPEDGLKLQGRVGFRAMSSDHLPLVGLVPDSSSFERDYSDLWKANIYKDYPDGSYLSGLYLSCGHGSKGILNSYMAANVLSNIIANEETPLENSLLEKISPARFLIQSFIRHR